MITRANGETLGKKRGQKERKRSLRSKGIWSKKKETWELEERQNTNSPVETQNRHSVNICWMKLYDIINETNGINNVTLPKFKKEIDHLSLT